MSAINQAANEPNERTIVQTNVRTTNKHAI